MPMSNTNQEKRGGPIQHRGSEGDHVHCLALKDRSNHHHFESPREKDEYLQVVGTQCTLAGISDTIGATDRRVDHRAGQHLSAILQRRCLVPAAVELGNKDGKSSGMGSALWKGGQTHHTPHLCSAF